MTSRPIITSTTRSNLTRDEQGGIQDITRNVYCKIRSIAKDHVPGEAGAIDYRYDPSGNRVGKTVWMYAHPQYNAKLNWYVRDAQGNVMAVYQSHYKPDWSLDSLTLIEHHMYGSSRLGIIERNQNMDSLKAKPVNASLVGNTYLYQTVRGKKFFELSNHLGNVLVTVSDKKIGVDNNSDGNVDYYNADVITANDMYSGGMQLPGRTYQAGSTSYRYGFNGKENDNEVKGEGNQIAFENRVYDSRLGRWLSVDPKAHEMPSWSPYVAMADNPILYLDPDGAFPYTFHIRAFAPPGAFKGTGFHDDKRGFSTSMNVTSRIKQNFTVDPTARTFTGGQPTSDPTIWNGISRTATDEGGASASFGKNFLGSATADISANFEGSNPFFLGAAPDIEVSTGISITENLKTNQLFVALDLSSKQFPATEGLIQDNAGNTIFLAGAAAFGGASNLVNADKKKVASVDLIIGINDKGVFQNVTMGGKQYTLEEFNKLGTAKPAGPFPREDKDK